MTTAHRLRHQAFYYSSDGQLLDTVTRFVEEGLEEGEPAMVALPEPSLRRLRFRLLEREATAWLVDMREVGRNPACIISAIQDFVDAHPGRRTRMVGEPIWRGRTPRETAEATRHEALINLAFADAEVSILCPYDAALDGRAIACSHRTHPELIRDGACSGNPEYAVGELAALDADPLPHAPDAAATLSPAGDLGELRRWLHPQFEAAGLIGDRADVRLIYLKGDETLIARRIATRHEHFMPRSLLHSQFEGLEEPGPDENPIIVSIEPPPRAIVARILSAMNVVEGAPPQQPLLHSSGGGP